MSQTGAANGCPFCKARIEKELSVGGEIVLLAGTGVGRRYHVVEPLKVSGDWQCQPVGGEPGLFFNVSLYSDLFLKLPTPDVPKWALSLCVEDNCLIDDVLMRIASRVQEFGTLEFDLKHLSHLIAFCWIHRIPVIPSELSEFLVAHGHPHELGQITKETIERGIYLLTFANGKNPIKRRKMKPFEIFKYLPSTESEEKREIYQWLYGPPLRYTDTQAPHGS